MKWHYKGDQLCVLWAPDHHCVGSLYTIFQWIIQSASIQQCTEISRLDFTAFLLRSCIVCRVLARLIISTGILIRKQQEWNASVCNSVQPDLLQAPLNGSADQSLIIFTLHGVQWRNPNTGSLVGEEKKEGSHRKLQLVELRF